MGVLEQVTELKNRGVPENKIVSTLREQGVSPKDINDAIGQSKIKSAVSSGHGSEQMEPSIMPPINSGDSGGEVITGGDLSNEDLTPPPSFTKIPAAAQRNFGRMTQEVSENEDDYVPQPQGEDSYYQADVNYQQQGYAPQYQESYEYQPQQTGGGMVDSDTMIEIAEQVFSEKTKPLQKSIEDLTEIGTLLQTKVENFSERLKRVENTIDHLQSSILDRVGSYGANLESIKKEMTMMQDSFGKIVNTAADHAEHKHPTHSTHPAHHEPLNHTVHKSEKTTTVVHKSSPKHAKKKSTKKKRV